MQAFLRYGVIALFDLTIGHSINKLVESSMLVFQTYTFALIDEPRRLKRGKGIAAFSEVLPDIL